MIFFLIKKYIKKKILKMKFELVLIQIVILTVLLIFIEKLDNLFHIYLILFRISNF